MNASIKKSPRTIVSTDRQSAVEREMLRLVSEFARTGDSLASAFSFHLSSGGKRTRAEVCLSSSQSLGLSHDDSVVLATVVELLHNASLIQDDFQDRSPLRRGTPAIWNHFGPDTAIGLTDLAISASFRALADFSRLDRLPFLLNTLHRAIAVTLRGQADDLNGAPESATSALSTALRKSGPLFSLSLELPLIASGQESYLSLAREAAEGFGVGYQICDDLSDVEEDRSQKSCGNLVLVLEQTMTKEAALADAHRLASEHLDRTVSTARLLPQGCGDTLVALTAAVQRRLLSHSDG